MKKTILKWNKVGNIDRKLNYIGNIKNGANLPEINKIVLLFVREYESLNKNKYKCISGYFTETDDGIRMILSNGNTSEITDKTRWAYINFPDDIIEDNSTLLNKNDITAEIGYALAYKDEHGNNFIDNIPNIVEIINIRDILDMTKKIQNRVYSDITLFTYKKPCTYEYNWDYIKEHMKEIHLS